MAQMLSHALLLLAAASASPGAMTTADEILNFDVPDEFAVGFHVRNERMDMTELVKPPETVENWTQLVTGQLFYGSGHIGASGFYGIFLDGMRKSCAGLTSIATEGMVDGQKAVRATLSCPKNPQTGLPENLELVAIGGTVNLLVTQIAFRRTLTTQDHKLVEHVVQSLKICDQRDIKACEARASIGFSPSAAP